MPRASRPPIDADFLRRILDYDMATGLFRWRPRADRSRRWNTRYSGQVAGSPTKGYVQIQIPKPRNYYAHVLAWLYVYGEWQPDLDHRNGVRSDNRIDNLRVATSAQNGANKAMQRNNTSGFVGVCWNKQAGKWEARINLHGKCRWRCFFHSAIEASQARQAALESVHGSYAMTDGRKAAYPRRSEPEAGDVLIVRSRVRCAGCGGIHAIMEIDHILAVTRGGTHHISNLQLLCLPCNRAKGNR